MGKRPGAKYAALQRLDALMADGQKRSEAKAEARLQGESLFAFTDGKIHAFETRHDYQKVVMRFLNWCRDEYDLRDLARIDKKADELVSLFLSERVEKQYSAWTLQAERSALRLFFQDRTIAQCVVLPQRRRADIKRSRQPAVRDDHINLNNWQHVIQFCLACGLRREELRDLKVGDVLVRSPRQVFIQVRKGKGGKSREVPVYPGRESAVLDAIAGKTPDEHVFTRVSGLLDIHSYRRRFAQDYYVLLSGRPLPPTEGRINPEDVDYAAILQVSRYLGHNRVDVIFQYYVR